ncbi:MAG: polyamine aminopropyltransferase [Planctomycetota bacterium]
MRARLAFLAVFLISACGLGYQLIAGTVSSYLLGDSVTQFSVTIGLYLSALGLGSYLTRYLERDLADRFIAIELAVAVAGGFSALALMFAYGTEGWFRPLLYGNILVVGTLVGIEIPLLMRLLQDELDLKELLAKVLAWDYVGALAVALAFPLAMLPRLGVARAALALGFVNALTALWSVSIFRDRVRRPTSLRLQAGIVLALLAVGLAQARYLTALAEHSAYANEIVYATNTPYQRVVITRGPKDFQLFLSGALQFNSADEYRYHEALVHPAFAVVAHPRRVLILGGGDGLAAREALRYDEVESVTLVDLDPEVTRLARELPSLAELNRHSLDDPRVEVVNADAMSWLQTDTGRYDVVVVDFPDPHSFSVGKLYTRTFYERLLARLAPDGAVGLQATSPRLAPASYWCIARTLEAAGFSVRPYRCGVPSFGEWGFMLAAPRAFEAPTRVPDGLAFLTSEFLPSLFLLPADAQPPDEPEPNLLSTQLLVRIYEREVGP